MARAFPQDQARPLTGRHDVVAQVQEVDPGPQALGDRDGLLFGDLRIAAEIGARVAEGLWNGINLPNLRENIVPTRQRASLILTKGASHRIETVALRRL